MATKTFKRAASYKTGDSQFRICRFKREITMAKNPVGWFEIYVDEMQRAKKFYESVLSVELQKLEGPDVEMWAFPMDQQGSGASGSLVHMDGFPVGKNSVLVYFMSNDCAVEEA